MLAVMSEVMSVELNKKGAIGFIEAEGLPAAIAAADAAVKSANVRLVGRENSRGGGLVTIKIAGDVGAVKAAIEAAKAASNQVRRAYSVLVIPRPAEGVRDALVWNENTMGVEQTPKPEPAPAPRALPMVVEPEPEAQTPQPGDQEAPLTATFQAEEASESTEAEAKAEEAEGDLEGHEGPAGDSAPALEDHPEDNPDDIAEDVSGDGPEDEGGEPAPSQPEGPKPRGRRRASNRGKAK